MPWIEGRVIERIDWTEDHHSLRVAADIGPFRAGQFTRLALDIDGERVARPYSLVNPPGEAVAEFYFNVVRGGPLSPRLARLAAGDRLWLARPPSGFLTLEEVPEAEDLWLVATGTGIGPFLSILATDTPWQRFRHIVLLYGVRTWRELAYRERIEALVAAHPGQLQFLPHVTREVPQYGIHGRIPAALESGELEARTGLSIAPERSQFLLCGNQGMIDAVSAWLKAERGLRKNLRRAPGHITVEKYW